MRPIKATKKPSPIQLNRQKNRNPLNSMDEKISLSFEKSDSSSSSYIDSSDDSESEVKFTIEDNTVKQCKEFQKQRPKL